MTATHHVTPRDKADPGCERTEVTLCIYSGSIDPGEISKILMVQPTRMIAKGQRIANKVSGREREGRTNSWLLSSEENVQSKDIRDHLDWLLSMLNSAKAGLIQLQALPDVRMRVYCVWWASKEGGGPTLWPEQMGRLADLKLECSFDFQDYNDDAQESD